MSPTVYEEIRADIAVLREQYAHIRQIIEDHISKEDIFQDQVRESLLGNGRPGIKTRLDRLEQQQVSRSKMFWLLAAGTATVLLDAAWQWIKRVRN